jgi:4-coumarate--CoA ligase
MGYLNNPRATAEAFDKEGFLRTGDEGSIDGEGLITIHDRIKEMIKVKGIQVAPAELEDLLLGHQKVEDCAVIGVPDEYSGERPLGFVVLKPGIKYTVEVEEELLNYVKDKKIRTKWLVGVRIVDQIPKSASGKILRRILRDRFRDQATGMKAKL